MSGVFEAVFYILLTTHLFGVEAHILITDATSGVFILYKGYLTASGYTVYHNIHYKYTNLGRFSIEACFAYCMESISTEMRFVAINHCSYPGYYWCHCGVVVPTAMGVDGWWIYMILWRSPVNSASNQLEIGKGKNQVLHVTYRQHVGGNDQLDVFVVTDLNDITSSNLIKMNAYKNLPYSVLTKKKYQIDGVTKRESSSVETFDPTEVRNKVINVQYEQPIEVNDLEFLDDKNVWFISAFENDLMITGDIKLYTIKTPNERNCKGVLKVGAKTTATSTFKLLYEMETSDDCNADIENVTIQLHMQNEMVVKSIENNKTCIDPTETYSLGSILIIKFRRLFIYSEICTSVELGGSVNLNGALPVIVTSNVSYAELEANVSTIKIRKDRFKTFVSKNVQGFFIRNEENGYCIAEEGGGANEVLTANCTRFKLSQHNLVSTNGKCLEMVAETRLITFVDCKVKKKRLSLKQRDIKFNDPSGDYYYNGAATSTTTTKTATNRYKRINDLPFAVSSDALDQNQSFENTNVSILLVDNDFTVCGPPNTRNIRCIVYSTTSSKVKELSQIVHGVLGYDKKRKLIIGSGELDRKLSYERYASNNHVSYISERMWGLVSSTDQMVLAKQYSMNSLYLNMSRNQFNLSDKSYSVSSNGLIDESTNYQIVIFAPEKKCGDKVARSKASALPSCKEIKRYCKTVKSGIFWIGGKLMKEFKQVYCDMETRYGGWTLIGKYEIKNGIQMDMSNNFTENLHDVASSEFQRFLSNPSGLLAARTYMGFDQLRLFCRADASQRTIHLETLNLAVAHYAVGWYTGQNAQVSNTACKSYSIYPDDTSQIVHKCSTWGNGGRWGSPASGSSNYLYWNPIHITNNEGFSANKVKGISCDDYLKGEGTTDGIWLFYVR